MKYRDESETLTASAVMILGQLNEPERDQKIADAIAESLKKKIGISAPLSLVPQGRIQFVARISLTIVPEYGMAQEGLYARIAGEFEMPVISKEKAA